MHAKCRKTFEAKYISANNVCRLKTKEISPKRVRLQIYFVLFIIGLSIKNLESANLPEEVVVIKLEMIPLIDRGKFIGSAGIPIGTKLKIIGEDGPERLYVRHPTLGKTFSIQKSSSDFGQRKKAIEDAKIFEEAEGSKVSNKTDKTNAFFKLINGETINYQVIKRTEPDGIVVLTESGVSKVRFSKMTKEDQLRYGYDPVKAAAYEDEILQKEIEKIRNRQNKAVRNTKTTEANAWPVASKDLPQKKGEAYDLALVENEPVSDNLGIVGNKSYLPPPTEKGRSILIKIPFIQTRPGVEGEISKVPPNQRADFGEWLSKQNWLAGNIATCSSMAVKYYGEKANPREVYCMASGEQYSPSKNRYSWDDYWYAQVADGLRKLGYQWVFKGSYRNTSFDFQSGIQEIKRNLDNGCPVIVSVTWNESCRDKFRAVVVNGYDDSNRVVYITDPSIAAPGLRIVSYKNFEKVWHTLDGTDVRYVMLSSYKK